MVPNSLETHIAYNLGDALKIHIPLNTYCESLGYLNKNWRHSPLSTSSSQEPLKSTYEVHMHFRRLMQENPGRL